MRCGTHVARPCENPHHAWAWHHVLWLILTPHSCRSARSYPAHGHAQVCFVSALSLRLDAPPNKDGRARPPAARLLPAGAAQVEHAAGRASHRKDRQPGPPAREHRGAGREFLHRPTPYTSTLAMNHLHLRDHKPLVVFPLSVASSSMRRSKPHARRVRAPARPPPPRRAHSLGSCPTATRPCWTSWTRASGTSRGRGSSGQTPRRAASQSRQRRCEAGGGEALEGRQRWRHQEAGQAAGVAVHCTRRTQAACDGGGCRAGQGRGGGQRQRGSERARAVRA